MAILAVTSVLCLFILTDLSHSIQVSPNSPCAPTCLDNPSQDVSDPNTSNTVGADITCLDQHYGNTPKGQKFVACMNCLQTSTFSTSSESDQGWFLYNLRYTLDTCLFGFDNASDAKSTVCSTSQSCGPLQSALENDNLVPSSHDIYSYCNADGNAFRGRYFDSCESCFKNTDDQKYLRNFLAALDAGCNQRSPTGTLIGLQGSLFSDVQLNGTFPGDSVNKKPKHKTLAQGAIIGIAVGLVILIVASIALFFICTRKRRDRMRLKKLRSPLDERYGARNITSPTDGAYGNPYSNSSPPIKAVDPFSPQALYTKEQPVIGLERTQFSQPIPFSPDLKVADHLQDGNSCSSPNPPPSYTSPQIPTHQAYISKYPVSPQSTTTVSSQETYKLSPYTSAYSAPRAPPPTQSPQIGHPSSRQPQPSQIQIQNNLMQASRTSPIGPHAQVSPPSQASPPLEQRPASRESGRRGTRTMGIGNVNASMEKPTNISGPMARHGGRFDFELAERERREREGSERVVLEKRKKKHADDSPADDELW